MSRNWQRNHGCCCFRPQTYCGTPHTYSGHAGVHNRSALHWSFGLQYLNKNVLQALGGWCVQASGRAHSRIVGAAIPPQVRASLEPQVPVGESRQASTEAALGVGGTASESVAPRRLQKPPGAGPRIASRGTLSGIGATDLLPRPRLVAESTVLMAQDEEQPCGRGATAPVAA